MPTESYDEVRTLMLSLALSRKDAIPIAVLDQDYYDVQEERIPWRKFGYPDLIAFLRSMPQSFHIEWQNGCHYVHGIASEKSKHVSSLVSRQKSDVKSKNHHFRQHRSVNRYTPRMQRQRVRIPAEQLHFIIEHIKYNPDGLSIQNIIMILQKQLPQVKLSVQDVREQLRELQHQLFMDGEIIFPVSPFNHIPQKPTNYQNSSTPQLQTQSAHDRKVQNEYIAGDEDWMEDHDNIQNDYLPAGCESSNYSTQMTSERLTANFAQNTNDKQMTMPEYNDYDKKININEYFTTNNCSNIVTDSKDEVPGERCTDASTLISDRTKSRLEELVRKYPDGIWCAELPDKYLNEYKVRLNYTELGFSSVREYVSYMPNIFYMTRMKANDDFILFSADKRPTIPDQESSGSQTAESVGTGKRYDEHNPRTRCNNDDAIPTNIPTSITSKFIPDDVMNYNDSVDLISVIDLQCKEYLEVYIAESFNPSFFWIHLRENKKSLYSLMDNLHYFYQNNYESYTIPKVALNKGLNCACVFGERWHRAIIKNVKPDYRVTVFFYDFGTVKTYPPETVFYLHKEFSRFPAHGIPCGLYNIKPCVGDRWKRSVNNQFMDKIADNVFVATVNSIDPTHNSMMITLTDTSEEEHININDWLVNQNLARQGKLGNAVDMMNLVKYAINNKGHVPMYCYAEENLVADYCSKTRTIEPIPEVPEVPLVSPGQTLLRYNNQQQQPSRPPRPPPGFPPFELPNVYSLGNALPFDKVETTTNPFLDDQLSDMISTNIVKQIFAQRWKENSELQIKLSKILYDLLKQPLIKKSTFENYIMEQDLINSILKNMEKLLLTTGDKIDVSTPNVNEMSLHDVGSTSKTFYSNDKFATDASSNLSSLFDADRSMNQTAHLNSVHCDLNNFTFKNDWSQSIGEFNSHIQVPPQLAVNPMSAIFNYGATTSPSFQKTDENKNILSSVPSVPSVPAGIPMKNISSSNSSNSSGFLSIKTDVCNNVRKETNPFKLSIAEMQIPETQSEQKVNDYNANSAYLSAINLQNHTTNVKSANVYPNTDTFLPATYACDVNNATYAYDVNNATYACDVNNMPSNYTPRIVFEAGPVVYDTQKKEINTNSMQSTFCSNLDNAGVASFMVEQNNKELPSQLVNDMTALSLKCGDNTNIDEGYVTRPSTTHNLQNSPPMINDELKYHQKDVNKPPSVLAQPWKKLEIPERWINSKFESDNFLPIYSSNSKTVSTSINIPPHQNSDNNKEPIFQNSSSINQPDYISQGNDNQKLMNEYRYMENAAYEQNEISIQENLSRDASSNFFFKNCFVFNKTDTIKGITFIFHIEENGWILTHEFVTIFTNYKMCSSLMDIINTTNIKVLLREINRAEYPAEFSQLDRYLLDVPRDENGHITSINLISLQSALSLLHKLKIVSREEMDNAFKKNEFLDGSVLPKMWSLIIEYRQLRQRIETYINNRV